MFTEIQLPSVMHGAHTKLYYKTHVFLPELGEYWTQFAYETVCRKLALTQGYGMSTKKQEHMVLQ